MTDKYARLKTKNRKCEVACQGRGRKVADSLFVNVVIVRLCNITNPLHEQFMFVVIFLIFKLKTI